jgi:FkbM family methyltransferase
MASVDEKSAQSKPKSRFASRINHYWHRALGRAFELLGDRLRIDGMVFSLDAPVINRAHKWSLFTQQHEEHERGLVKRWLPEHLPIIEFGGAIGVVSCSANRKLNNPEQHIVVEANPEIIPLLERNRDLNGCRFQIKNKALAYDAESVRFVLHWNPFGGRLGDHGEKSVSVPSVSLKAILDENGFDQVSVICDIEGAEAMLVDRELDTLRNHVKFFLVEIHPNAIGAEGLSRMLQSLLEAGFILKDQSGRNWAFTRS